MRTFHLKQHPQVVATFASYPDHIREKMNYLRALILSSAEEVVDIQEMEECLKWGEPSYVVKGGSTIRMDWKPKRPQQYAIYFNCNTQLVETFKVIYGELFCYEKNRAIIFQLDTILPEKELKECIKLALQYHSRKHMPLLGK
ncbi:MAG: DUF1801 domain-containing protein [Bacteroidota bacterium]